MALLFPHLNCEHSSKKRRVESIGANADGDGGGVSVRRYGGGGGSGVGANDHFNGKSEFKSSCKIFKQRHVTFDQCRNKKKNTDRD